MKGFAGDNRVAWTEVYRADRYEDGRLRGYTLVESTQRCGLCHNTGHYYIKTKEGNGRVECWHA